jgi:hypothetical protein
MGHDWGTVVDIKARIRNFWPVGIVFLLAIGFILYRLSIKEWDPVGLAEIGTRYQRGDIDGSEGYDGQFAYYIALNPKPDEVSNQLDVPAYRYQRILYPLLARLLTFGHLDWIPWSLIFINVGSLLIGTAILCKYMNSLQTPVRYALIFGLWAGLVLGVGADLYEPLAYALIVAAMYAHYRKRQGICSLFLTASMLTKETVIPFWAALVLANFLQKKSLKEILISILPGIVYAFWQVWLYSRFGTFGLASGGAMATSFEWIPYGGFFRIGTAGTKVLILFIVIFGPSIILPNLWGTLVSSLQIFRGFQSYENWALLLNTLFITFLPFSTFREPLGLLRVSTGMVLAIVLFAAHHTLRRPLNFGMFWMSFLILLVA